jgi:hypothetical protein
MEIRHPLIKAAVFITAAAFVLSACEKSEQEQLALTPSIKLDTSPAVSPIIKVTSAPTASPTATPTQPQ